MKNIVENVSQTKSQVLRVKTNYTTRSPTAKSDSGSRPRISKFSFRNQGSKMENRDFVASGNKYFWSKGEPSTVEENDQKSISNITFPQPPNYSKMSDIYWSISPFRTSPHPSEVAADEHVFGDLRKTVNQIQPRQKKFMNQRRNPWGTAIDKEPINIFENPKENLKWAFFVKFFRNFITNTIFKCSKREEKLLKFFKKLIERIEFYNLVPILNDYISPERQGKSFKELSI